MNTNPIVGDTPCVPDASSGSIPLSPTPERKAFATSLACASPPASTPWKDGFLAPVGHGGADHRATSANPYPVFTITRKSDPSFLRAR